jgi:hypothetical protein
MTTLPQSEWQGFGALMSELGIVKKSGYRHNDLWFCAEYVLVSLEDLA